MDHIQGPKILPIDWIWQSLTKQHVIFGFGANPRLLPDFRAVATPSLVFSDINQKNGKTIVGHYSKLIEEEKFWRPLPPLRRVLCSANFQGFSSVQFATPFSTHASHVFLGTNPTSRTLYPMDGMYLRSGSKLGGLFIFAYFEGSEKVDADDDAKVTREVTTIFGKCQLQQQQPTFMTNFLIASMKDLRTYVVLGI